MIFRRLHDCCNVSNLVTENLPSGLLVPFLILLIHNLNPCLCLPLASGCLSPRAYDNKYDDYYNRILCSPPALCVLAHVSLIAPHSSKPNIPRS